MKRAIFSTIAYFYVYCLFGQGQSLEKVLLETANEVNKNCPLMVDKDTRLDNAMSVPKKKFHYNYTLINMEKHEVNMDDVNKNFIPTIVNRVKTSPNYKTFRKYQVTIVFNYSDKKGVFIFRIPVTPEMYNERKQ